MTQNIDLLLCIGGSIAYILGMVKYGARTSVWWFYLALAGFISLAAGITLLVS